MVKDRGNGAHRGENLEPHRVTDGAACSLSVAGPRAWVLGVLELTGMKGEIRQGLNIRQQHSRRYWKDGARGEVQTMEIASFHFGQ